VPVHLSKSNQKDNFHNRVLYVFWLIFYTIFPDQKGDKNVDHNFP